MWLESPNNLGWQGSLEVIWFYPLLRVGLASGLEQHAQDLHNQVLSISKAGTPTAFLGNLSRADWSHDEECFLYDQWELPLLQLVTIASHAIFAPLRRVLILSSI